MNSCSIGGVEDIATMYDVEKLSFATSWDVPSAPIIDAIKVWDLLFGDSMRDFYKAENLEFLNLIKGVKMRRKRSQKQRFNNYLKSHPAP